MTDEGVTGTARAQVPARLLDLSLGGALLDLATALEVGAIHDFSLQLDGETLWVQAEVRRCQQVRADGYRVGVQFIGIHPHDERRLREYVQQHRH
ncbi:MAG TPA: PilZ domain-containing protein [Vicinamibacteria bacterium]|nr:PilZ domain-containing protein [Vicinamibacteria bacterium]